MVMLRMLRAPDPPPLSSLGEAEGDAGLLVAGTWGEVPDLDARRISAWNAATGLRGLPGARLGDLSRSRSPYLDNPAADLPLTGGLLAAVRGVAASESSPCASWSFSSFE